MPKYKVFLETFASMVVEVEAEDEDQAIEKAYEEAPRDVCAQCSGWGQKWNLELGEWEPLEETTGQYAMKAVEEVKD